MKLPKPKEGKNYTEKEILALGLPLNPIQEGCNYHTTWQRNPAMRFVLSKVENPWVTLRTRTTGKIFTTSIQDLKFIHTQHNYSKYLSLCQSTPQN